MLVRIEQFVDRHWWIRILLLGAVGILIWTIVEMNEYLKTLT